ncbi:hypothetical protein GCK32_016589 [Trichostrongylus colubriformis]|uniref:Uncharacterized protein n=1 Tax=Trichostrongylus colubriformis TaxID=6319 RepID=A0AAN8F2E5_TRICO
MLRRWMYMYTTSGQRLDHQQMCVLQLLPKTLLSRLT